MTQTRNALHKCSFPSLSGLARPVGSGTDTVPCGALAEQESRSGLCLAASSAPRTALSTSDWISVWRKLGAVWVGARARNFCGRRRGGIREDVPREERFTLSIEGCDLGKSVSEGKTSVCKTPSPEKCTMVRRRMRVGGTGPRASRSPWRSASLVLDTTGSNWKV